MIDLEYASAQTNGYLLVQEEPALEIALPQIFTQPTLTTLRRGKLQHIEALVARIHKHHQANGGCGLGEEYQDLVNEFQPLFRWAMACWDYLLTTEGCRFIPRHRESRVWTRGDYRAVTDSDYSRLVHGIFRACVLDFARYPEAASLTQWLRECFWQRSLEAYRRLEKPADPHQRTLTPYSYLRCVPYRFLNHFHHELAYSAIGQLPQPERQAIEIYFLHFYTESACSQALGCSLEECGRSIRKGLVDMLATNRLVYHLLRQIERY